MSELTGYHARMADLMTDLIQHGWGEINFKVQSQRDDTVKIIVSCGKSYTFVIKKYINFNKDDLL